MRKGTVKELNESMGLFFKKRAIGLELDTCAVRAVELTGSAANPILTAWGRVSLPQGAVEEGMVIDVQAVGKGLSRLWSENGFKSSEVVLGVSNQGVLVRFAQFPRAEPDKLNKIIHYQAQDYLPLPMSSVVLHYAVIGEKGDLLEVLLVAARKDMLQGFLSAIDAARLKPRDITVSTLALLRVLPKDVVSGVVALVDLSNGLSNFMVVEKGIPRLVRQISVKLKNLASNTGYALEKILDIDRNDSNLKAWIETLAGEIRSSINYYQSQPAAKKVEGIILGGRGARIEELAVRLKELLSIPVKTLQPLSGVVDRSPKKDASPKAMDFAVSISLARRGLEV